MMSAPLLLRAVSRIFAAGTMTPEIDDLVIVALEHDADDGSFCRCRARPALDGGHQRSLPLEVLPPRSPLSFFSCSMNGIR